MRLKQADPGFKAKLSELTFPPLLGPVWLRHDLNIHDLHFIQQFLVCFHGTINQGFIWHHIVGWPSFRKKNYYS